jgi:hypothetical protein
MHGFKNSQRPYLLIFLISSVTVMGLLYLLNRHTSVVVTVRNLDTKSLREVTVEVTGVSYVLGTLKSGAKRTVVVRPRSESDIQVTFVDDLNRFHSLSANCYLEPRWASGTIVIGVKGNKIESMYDSSRGAK